ncbi:hypothetical protein [Aliikangiella coralliicola]|uniref:GNAT family N-acetyltransferase n=1 Tax=Aliikangiella coralliicola TaxID=2592383 RepID=A0A545UA85_9GAMM|nr:hypothetical protein [Aliikangiella coralliicola]TQV86381.1 hypothetical protein FLL46_15790 [Aliikangiella coralliicola]
MTHSITHHRDIRQSKLWLTESISEQIKSIVSTCFTGICADDYLAKYFFDENCFERKLRLFYDGKKLVGYCLLTFSDVTTAHRKIVCIGASAAFFREYRNGNQTVSFSIIESIKYWLLHPWKKIYYADTMLSPAMYRVVAKSVNVIYPNSETESGDRQTPEDISTLVKLLKRKMDKDSSGESSGESSNQHPNVVYVGRKSNYSDDDIHNFFTSPKEEIRCYCKINPQFNEGYALIAVIPMCFKQLTSLKLS